MNKSFTITISIFYVIIVLLFINCTSDKINSPQEGGVIEGKVSSSLSNEGLTSVLVELKGGLYTYPDTTTDENGYFSFKDVVQGKYILQTIKYGYESGQDTITVYSGNLTTANLVLSPGEPIGTWIATNVYIPQLNQNFVISDMGQELEITFSETGEYRGVTSDSLSTVINEGNWLTFNGVLIIIDSEFGERQGDYTIEENILILNNWMVDYQGVMIAVDVTFVKK